MTLGPRLLDRRLPPVGFSAASYVLALCVGMAVNLGREGTDGWSRMFTIGEGAFHEGPNEYLPGLPTLGYGVRFYLDRFAEMATSQPVNVAGHPPGPLLLMDALGITTAGGLAALCIVAGAFCAPLAHRLSWTLDDEPTGRIAGLLCALSPALVLLGVSSYDVVFAAFGALAACLLVARGTWWRAAGLVVFALATLMSWALLAIGAWAAIVAWRREGWRAALVLAAACGVAVLVLNGALALATGYDPIGALAATKQVYDNSLATRRPYLVLGLRLPRRLGGHDRRADHRRRTRRPRRPPPRRDRPRGDRARRRTRRLHEGGDRADLAVHGPARLRRGGAVAAAPRGCAPSSRSSPRRPS